ncbi:MAG: hypothetical protein KL863_19745 [Rhizobium sp.]|nr:hypothetical protein [Rhizobium sp.]
MANSNSEVTFLNEQIADLKAELVELSGKVRSGMDDVERAAQPAIGVIKDNPGTVSSVALAAGLIGIAIGYMIGSTSGSTTSRRWH